MKISYSISFSIIIFLLLMISCKTTAEPDGSVIIKFNEVHQKIDGFGGSNAWMRLPSDPETAKDLVKLLFSRTEGMGFTILRTRIPFRERLEGDRDSHVDDGFVVRNNDNSYKYTENENGVKTFSFNWNSWDIASTRRLIQLIKELGDDGPEKLVITSAPWTTPNNRVTKWKEDVTGVSSNLNYTIDWSRPDVWGRLRRDKYEDYADLLADYVLDYEKNMGAPLDILSIQNEPNWKVEYESTYWSGEDIRDFLKVIAVRFPMKNIALGEDGPAGGGSLFIMAPEYENFDVNVNTMIKPMLDDPLSNSVLTHIGLHQYNGAYDQSQRAGAKAFPVITESGKRFWQTEVSGSGPQLPEGIGIDNALYYARMIHFDMTLTQINAFLYWWLWQMNPEDDDIFPGALIGAYNPEFFDSLRLYAMGQYSRFIRPGWHRIEGTTNPVRARHIFSSVYKNKDTNEIAVVVVNNTAGDYTISLNIEDAEFNELNIWRTSSSEKLEPLGSQKIVKGNANVHIAPKSITTFYGTVK